MALLQLYINSSGSEPLVFYWRRRFGMARQWKANNPITFLLCWKEWKEAEVLEPDGWGYMLGKGHQMWGTKSIQISISIENNQRVHNPKTLGKEVNQVILMKPLSFLWNVCYYGICQLFKIRCDFFLSCIHIYFCMSSFAFVILSYFSQRHPSKTWIAPYKTWES